MTTMLDMLLQLHYIESLTPTFSPGNDPGGNDEKRGLMSLLKRKFGAMETSQQALPFAVAATSDRVDSGHRIRVGLTGLAAIFLLMLIAAAGLRPDRSMAAPDAAGEPLAVLGVAPGAGPAGAERVSTLTASARPATLRPKRG
jgi:hypothetical protein